MSQQLPSFLRFYAHRDKDKERERESITKVPYSYYRLISHVYKSNLLLFHVSFKLHLFKGKGFKRARLSLSFAVSCCPTWPSRTPCIVAQALPPESVLDVKVQVL